MYYFISVNRKKYDKAVKKYYLISEMWGWESRYMEMYRKMILMNTSAWRR